MKFPTFTFLAMKRRWLKLPGNLLFHTTTVSAGPGNFGALFLRIMCVPTGEDKHIAMYK
jgi:hypothetical protein